MTLYVNNKVNILKQLLKVTTNELNKLAIYQQCNLTTATIEPKKVPIEKKVEKSGLISKAMITFLENAAEHEKLIKEKEADYEIGKRHLAKIMGINDANHSISRREINSAIEYLLPSSLFTHSARPFMRPPRSFYPKMQALNFDKEGRPHHYLFYTTRPKFYEVLDMICDKISYLNQMEDRLFAIKKHENLDPRLTKISELNLVNTEWIEKSAFASKVNCELDDDEYSKLINSLEILAKHPLAYKEQDFILSFRRSSAAALNLGFKQELLKDPNGVPYATYTTKQRTATVTVSLRKGTGDVKIDAPEGSFDITFFAELKDRELILSPFKVTDGINKYDVHIKAISGGMSCIAKAARYAISNSLCAFVTMDKIEKLRIAGLLTNDRRIKERKKPGQAGARKKFTWVKR